MSYTRVRALVTIRHDGVLRIPGQTSGENSQDFLVSAVQAAVMEQLGLISVISAADPPSGPYDVAYVDAFGLIRRPDGEVVGGFGPVDSAVDFLAKAFRAELVPGQIYVAGDVAYKALTASNYRKLTKDDYIDLGDAKYNILWDGSDETSKVLAAISDANNSTAGYAAIFVPPSPTGNLIRINSITLTSVRRITFFGTNRGSFNTGSKTKVSGFELIANPSATYMFGCMGASVADQSTQATENIKFTRLQLDGRRSLQTPGSGIHGVFIERRSPGADSSIEVVDCYIHDFTGDGVYVGGDASGSARATRIYNNAIMYCRNGVQTFASDGWIENNDIGLMYEDGVQVRNWTNFVRGNNVFSCRNGIWSRAGEASICIIDGNRVDRNKFTGIIAGGIGTIVCNNVLHMNSFGEIGDLIDDTGPGPVALAYDANLLNSHIRVDTSGVMVYGNSTRQPAGGTGGVNMCRYDLEISPGVTAIVGPNNFQGRTTSSLYGGIGLGAGARAIASTVPVEAPCVLNELKALDIGGATAYTLAAADVFNRVITLSGTPGSAVTVTTATASQMMNLASMSAAAIAGASLGASPPAPGYSQFRVRIINSTGQQVSLIGGTNVTTSGTMTIASGSYREFVLTFMGSGISANAVSITNVGGGSL